VALCISSGIDLRAGTVFAFAEKYLLRIEGDIFHDGGDIRENIFGHVHEYRRSFEDHDLLDGVQHSRLSFLNCLEMCQ
jgi:hypothetical protein